MIDYLLVGGGLQNTLIALALRRFSPAANVVILERGSSLGGNHLWCFHEDDIPPRMREVVAPLVAHRWESYDVVFPDHQRTLAMPYSGIPSARLDEVARAALGESIRLDCEVREIGPRHVVLASGERLSARVVIEARGPERYEDADPARDACGYLKFLGVELRLARPHDLLRPIIMDAKIRQSDGYRFIYVLPFAPDRVLVEDNYYSDVPTWNPAIVRAEVLDYAKKAGLAIAEVEREERGVLPLPWRAPALPKDSPPLVAGYQGGWFHPATSYSLPVAARLAEHVATTPLELLFADGWRKLVDNHRAQQRFARTLNYLLFKGTPPANRWRVMSGFYRHPEDTLRRFYALATTMSDKMRILNRGFYWFLAAHVAGEGSDGEPR